MRYLGLALYAEGPTDYQFLSPILRRVAEDHCLRWGIEPVMISEVIGVDACRADRDADRGSRILSAAKLADGAFQVLFVHTDGSGDPARARAERVEPGRRMLNAHREGWGDGVVAVVPVRETEAWALADGDAIRQALGTRLNDDRLGLPQLQSGVESLQDPKQALDRIYERAVGRRRSGRKASVVLPILAERIRHDSVRGLASFREFEADLRQSLRQLRYLAST